MTASLPLPARSGSLVRAAIEQACGAIAPTWPLDRFIAVNPLWSWVDRPIADAAAAWASLAGVRLTMRHEWYREQVRLGAFDADDVAAAIAERGGGPSPEQVLAALATDPEPPPVRARVTDVLDRVPHVGQPWRAFVLQDISQFCASWFDAGQASFRPPGGGGLYAAWRRASVVNAAPALGMGLVTFGPLVGALPEDVDTLVATALDGLAVPAEDHASYLTALLLDVNGWAAWCAHRRWDARLAGGDDREIADLLAIRLAWEWILLQANREIAGSDWRAAVAQWPGRDAWARQAQEIPWILQRAAEIAVHRRVGAALRDAPAAREDVSPSAQVVFCIDVRSEVLRRALEHADPSIQTLGFAGFFGLPIAYRPPGSARPRPQLPGLLGARLLVEDGVRPQVEERRLGRIDDATSWKRLARAPGSGFSYVETTGGFHLFSLLADALGFTRPAAAPDTVGLRPAEARLRRPGLTSTLAGEPVSTSDRVALAAGILRGMSLTSGFARLVVLVGHGSRTVNNPHAAGLDCGACGGQTGEVNARVAAALLNAPEVRAGLGARGIPIPDTTRFLAALHDTTTDQVCFFDLDELPRSFHSDLTTLRGAFERAGDRARAERAPRLGIPAADPRSLRRAFEARSRDWAQTRPEWGLANNAVFIAAPRQRTRSLDLAGRAFLHEYDWRGDENFAVLEQILIAPMVVAHWINFQYYASTVDNARLGSGDKVLHNVVGGHLGVFEGNTGDLRIGLPLQSLHDGERFVHTPLRLGVFVEAPADAIAGVIHRHERIRQLVENGWVYLYRIDPDGGAPARWTTGGWAPAAG